MFLFHFYLTIVTVIDDMPLLNPAGADATTADVGMLCQVDMNYMYGNPQWESMCLL